MKNYLKSHHFKQISESETGNRLELVNTSFQACWVNKGYCLNPVITASQASWVTSWVNDENCFELVNTSLQTNWVSKLSNKLSPSWVSWVTLEGKICHRTSSTIAPGKLGNMLSLSWVTMLSKNPSEASSTLAPGKLGNFFKSAQKKNQVGKSVNPLFIYLYGQKISREPVLPPYTMGVKKPPSFIWGVFVAGKNHNRIIGHTPKKTFWSSG